MEHKRQRQLARAVLALGVLALSSGHMHAQQHSRSFPSWLPVELTPSLAPGDTPSAPDSVRVRVGYQHWRGGALGAGIGGVVGALAGAMIAANVKCYDCGDDTSPGEGALLVGALGAGTGGVLGFLAGLASPRYVWMPGDGREK